MDIPDRRGQVVSAFLEEAARLGRHSAGRETAFGGPAHRNGFTRWRWTTKRRKPSRCRSAPPSRHGLSRTTRGLNLATGRLTLLGVLLGIGVPPGRGPVARVTDWVIGGRSVDPP